MSRPVSYTHLDVYKRQGAEGVGGEGEVDGGAGNIPQLMHYVGHVGHEIVVIAFAGVALRAEQMMGTK